MKNSNRIVVDYKGEEKLIFLSILNKEDELEWSETLDILEKSNISDYTKTTLLNKLSIDDVKSSQLEDLYNMEGYVYRFYPTGDRFKAKFPSYVEKHKILTNISNIDVWNLLKDGKDPLTLLDEIPDEIDNWLRSELLKITTHYQTIENDVLSIFNSMNLNVDKKEFAYQVFKFNKRIQPILFKLFDKKDYSDVIWNMVKPEYKTPWSENETCTL